MNNPTVTCCMLTADRQALAEKAVACFLAQTYEHKQLIIWDTGSRRFVLPQGSGQLQRYPGVSIIHARRMETDALGDLRNYVNGYGQSDIIAHWDDDDYRHPSSIEELATALVDTPGAAGCGYSDVLFAEQATRAVIGVDPGPDGSLDQVVSRQESWWRTYHWKSNLPGFVLGGSLMYRRSTWERIRFPLLNNAEDQEWQKALHADGLGVVQLRSIPEHDPTPRMIVRRHGGNTSKIDCQFQCDNAPDAWRRAREWDERVKGILG